MVEEVPKGKQKKTQICHLRLNFGVFIDVQVSQNPLRA